MTLNAVDLSNYSGPLTTAQAQGLKDAGIMLAIVQAVDPPPVFPAGCTRQQIQACLGAGLIVDAYIWLWFDLGADDIQRKLALLDGLPIRRLWLDVEDTAAKGYDQVVCEAKVQAALEACDAFPTTSGEKTGVYSGRWFWAADAYMTNTELFKDRDLWDSHYDNIADASALFVPYGGWTSCAIKQYMGTSTLAGVPNVDLNVLSDSELTKITNGGTPPVGDSERIAMQTQIDGLVTTVADIADRLGDQLLAECKRTSVRKTVVRGIVAQMENERVEAVGPRP